MKPTLYYHELYDGVYEWTGDEETEGKREDCYVDVEGYDRMVELFKKANKAKQKKKREIIVALEVLRKQFGDHCSLVGMIDYKTARRMINNMIEELK
jgi:hypothetical protein